MTTVPSSWLSTETIDGFIDRKTLEPYEKDCHKAGRRRLLKVVRRLTSSYKRKDFIIDINKRLVKDSRLYISPFSADREVFEFYMLDNDKIIRSYVGKKFTLVRGRNENEEDRKRNISDEYKRVSRELYTWNKLRKSSNFAKLLHISFEDGKSITAVLEKFDTDLRQALRLSTTGIDFVTIITGIANALDFLHKFTEDGLAVDSNQNKESSRVKKGITHGDIKCANVFLKDRIPYLADFGVSHQVVKGAFTRLNDTSGVQAIGSLPWMPPELLLVSDNKSRVSYTKECDVWSFGMTIYEIISRKDPWSQDVTKGLYDGADVQEKINKAMKSKRLPNWPSHIHKPLQTYSTKLHELHNQCCRYRTKKRLTMEKVVRKLNKIFHGPIGSKGH